MRRGVLLAFAVLALTLVLYLASCSEGPVPRLPSKSAIERLEQRLAKHPCVGSLDRWERHYTFKSEPVLADYVGGSILGISVWRAFRWYDYRTIDVDLMGTGRMARPEMRLEATQPRFQRHAVIPRYQGWIDDSGGPAVLGFYNIKADRLDVWVGCGRILHLPPLD